MTVKPLSSVASDPPRCTRTRAVHLPRSRRLFPWLPLNLAHQFLRSPHDLVLYFLRGGASLLYNFGAWPCCGSCSLGLRNATSRCGIGAGFGRVGSGCCALLWCDDVFNLLHNARFAVAGTGAC